MDLDQDNELSFEEWRQGMLTEPRLLQLFQQQEGEGDGDITAITMIDPKVIIRTLALTPSGTSDSNL